MLNLQHACMPKWFKDIYNCEGISTSNSNNMNTIPQCQIIKKKQYHAEWSKQILVLSCVLLCDHTTVPTPLFLEKNKMRKGGVFFSSSYF